MISWLLLVLLILALCAIVCHTTPCVSRTQPERSLIRHGWHARTPDWSPRCVVVRCSRAGRSQHCLPSRSLWPTQRERESDDRRHGFWPSRSLWPTQRERDSDDHRHGFCWSGKVRGNQPPSAQSHCNTSSRTRPYLQLHRPQISYNSVTCNGSQISAVFHHGTTDLPKL